MAGALPISSLELPLCIRQLNLEAMTLVFKEPLILDVRPSENHPYWEVNAPDIDLFAYGLTREELLHEAESSLRFLWNEIALADLDSLDDQAQIVHNNLLARIEVCAK